MRTQTSSSLSRFRECPRRYWHEFELKRVPIAVAPSLAIGKLWHVAMEYYWRDGLESAATMMKELAENVKPQDAAQICALLSCYIPPRSRFEVLGVEVPFEVKIENPDRNGRSFYGYRLAGKVDLILKSKETGDTWICDHKTTSSEILGFGTYWQALQIDGQMANYCLAYNARGFIYDVVRKPGIKLCGKDEAAAKKDGITPEAAYEKRCIEAIAAEPDATYQWREHLKDEADMREARQDLWQQVEMFRSCDNAGRFPRNSNACVTRYGTCPYIDVCTNRASIDDDMKFRTKEDAFEELVEAGEGGAS